MSFSTLPFRGPHQDPPSGRPHWSNWLLADLCLPKPVRQGFLTAAGGVCLCVGWVAGMRNKAFSRRNTCIYSVLSSWSVEQFKPQPSWGTWSICCQSFAGVPASDVSGICRRPPCPDVFTPGHCQAAAGGLLEWLGGTPHSHPAAGLPRAGIHSLTLPSFTSIHQISLSPTLSQAWC